MIFLCFEHDFSWFETTVESGRASASESCGQLMIGNNHKKDFICLLETLKGATESQLVKNKQHHHT